MMANVGNFGNNYEMGMDYSAASFDGIGAARSALLDCTISANNNAELSVSKRLIIHQCAALIPLLHCKNGHNKQWILKTTVDYEILRDIVHFLQYGYINSDDWLHLENILDQCHHWKLRKVENYIIRKFIGEINEDNCLSVWLMCKNSLPDQLTKVFEYLLYVINEAVNSDKNLDFFRLEVENLCEILNADMLNIKTEIDVWKLIKKWILIDKKRRESHLPSLLQCLRYNFLTVKEKEELNEDLIHMKFIPTHYFALQYNITNKSRIARDLLLALFGWEWLGPSNRIEVFDIVQRRWKRVPSMEDKRRVSYHGCVVINQKLYTIGGFDGSVCFNTTRCYDGETRQWTELAPMHHSRCYVAACELNGLIVAVGGCDGHFRLSAAEIYSPETNQWTTIRSMNQQRSDAAACSMAGKVYVAGGYNGERVLQSIEVYSFEKDIWIEIAHMDSPRSGLGCVSTDTYIIFAGGFDGHTRLNTVEKLRLGSTQTIQMPPMPFARSNFDLCKLGGKFYAIGGYTTCLTRHVLCFDGHRWDFTSDLCASRSALRAIVLRGWPDPRWILNNETETLRTNSVKTAKKSLEQSIAIHSQS